jgi:pre-mRNA-processing factor 39
MSKLLGSDFANSFATVEKQEEQRLRAHLHDKPSDLEAWLDLIKQVEKFVRSMQKSSSMTKEVLQDVLKEFPQYAPGWRKLADCYHSEANSEMVQCTYEEALKIIPTNIDLWLAYLNWKSERSSVEDMRALYERAVQVSGSVFASFLMWDKYLDFERSQKDWGRLEQVFWKVIGTPNSKLYDYFSRFKNFLETPGLFSGPDQDLAKRKKLEEIIVAYEQTVIENNKRKAFEAAIKRSHFSTNPLDPDQIANWRRYLDLEEREGDAHRIELLYARCLIPACYYAEFWVRYALYLERVKGAEAARELYRAANAKLLFRRPELFIAQGYFEETHGDLEEAELLYRKVYENVEEGSLEAIFKHLGLELRRGDLEAVERLYHLAAGSAESSGDSSTLAFVSMHFARFLQSVKGDLEGALAVFARVEPKTKDKKALYMAYLNTLSLAKDSEDRTQRMTAVYERAIASEKVTGRQSSLKPNDWSCGSPTWTSSTTSLQTVRLSWR